MKRARHSCLYLLIMSCPLHALEEGGPPNQPADNPTREQQVLGFLLQAAKSRPDQDETIANRPPTPIPPYAAIPCLTPWLCDDRPPTPPLGADVLTPTSRRRLLVERARKESVEIKAQHDSYETEPPRKASESNPDLKRGLLMARAASSHGSNPDLLALLLREDKATGPEGWPGVE